MATSVLQNCKLWVDGFDMSGWMNRLGLEYQSEPQDVTTWGNTNRVMKGGLKRFTFAHQGLWQTPGPTETVAFDSCTASNGTAFGVSKPGLPATRIPERGFGGWIVDRVVSGVDNGLDIQSNKAEQVNGHGGGQGGKYCTEDVTADNFTYFADLTPNDNTTNLGLGFRYEENPADGSGNTFYWEQNADGWQVAMKPGSGGNVGINLIKYVAGTATATSLVADGVAIPFRMVLAVSGSTLDVYREAIGGGSRTTLSASVDLAASIGGNTDDYNDTGHQRFGLVSASADNLSTFDNITVEAQRADKVVFDNVGTTPAFALSPEAGAVGDVAYLAEAGWAKYELGPATVGDLLRFSVNGNGAGPLVRGVVLANATVTSTSNGTAIQHGAVGATQKMYAVLHVLTVSDGTIAVTVESDDNESFSSATTRFTFDTVGVGESVEWATPVNGAITDDWWRASYTIAGGSPSIAFVLAMGIQ